MKKYKYICCVSTAYSLLLYLLYSKEEDIKRTFFFFHHTIPNDISKGFEGDFYKLPHFSQNRLTRNVKFRFLFWYKYIKFFKLPSFHNKQLFIQDHLEHSAIMIGHKNYTLIEDGPGTFNFYENGFWGKIDREFQARRAYKIKKVLCGPTIYRSFGHNEQCTDIILSSEYNLDYLNQKRLHYVNIKNDWAATSEHKKEYIRKLLSLDAIDTKTYAGKSIILFTQPLYNGCVSRGVHEEIYRKIISKYPQEKLVIKVHPRDMFPYETVFPQAVVVRNTLPSQFLQMIGVRFERAVTIFSTAVFDLGYELQVDWYGTECHPGIFKYSGHVNPPAGANLCKL